MEIQRKLKYTRIEMVIKEDSLIERHIIYISGRIKDETLKQFLLEKSIIRKPSFKIGSVVLILDSDHIIIFHKGKFINTENFISNEIDSDFSEYEFYFNGDSRRLNSIEVSTGNIDPKVDIIRTMKRNCVVEREGTLYSFHRKFKYGCKRILEIL